MDHAVFAHLLVAAPAADRPSLITAHAAEFAEPALAEALRLIYFASYSSTPTQAAAAAVSLRLLADRAADPFVQPMALWVEGLAALQLEGRSEAALDLIDAAAQQFHALDRAHYAAQTQVGKLFALARLGRYAEALACGQAARDTLLAHGDELAAGRIELNLGNLYFQRDQYAAAEACYRSAEGRFVRADDQRMLAFVFNGLANALSRQLRIAEAIATYEQALALAESTGQLVTQAEIACNLGGLALFQGRYAEALALLEGSRQRYAALDMPHESAVSELELGDAYLELGLLAEAAEIYQRICTTFATLDMLPEQARALLHYSRTCLHLGKLDQAHSLLEEALACFQAQEHTVGVALTNALAAWVAFQCGDDAMVLDLAAAAEAPLAAANAWEQLLTVRWLYGMALGRTGQTERAYQQLRSVFADAERHGATPSMQRSATALGQLLLQHGDTEAARHAFLQAVTLGEALRAPLPADALRIALAAETLVPYAGLVQICLAHPTAPQIAAALDYAERSRARALVEQLSGTITLPTQVHHAHAALFLEELSRLRAELNWLYSRLQRPSEQVTDHEQFERLRAAAQEREAAITALHLRMQHTRSAHPAQALTFDLPALQAVLGSDTVLVEYVVVADYLCAFVITATDVQVMRNLAPIEQITAAIQGFHFQIGALSHGAALPRAHLPTLTERTRAHLAQLAAYLIEPLEPLLGDQRLVVAPCDLLHYVPFHALATARGYLIERHEVCVVPSAAVFVQCMQRPRQPIHHALLAAVDAENLPAASAEVQQLAPHFPQATTLLAADATQAAVRTGSATADLIHLACHGRFRADNPLFSALQLADGWLTVHDIYSFQTAAQLVTLSACETGVNVVAPGNELIGLARGFFMAGTSAILVSQWRVDDRVTTAFMDTFYRHLMQGHSPAAALQAAQRIMLARHPHPFFWAAFTLLGRW